VRLIPVNVALTYETAAVPCAEFTKAIAVSALGKVGGQLADLARVTGLTSAVVAGTASAHGRIAYAFDGMSVTPPTVTFVPSNNCGLRFGF
jgi:hypothetical protein